MYKNLTRFTSSDSPAARQSLARVIIIPRFGRKDVSFWSRSCGENPIVVPIIVAATTANMIVIRMQQYFLLRLLNCCQHDVLSVVWSSRFEELSELNCKGSAECKGSIASSGKITKKIMTIMISTSYFGLYRKIDVRTNHSQIQSAGFRAKNIRIYSGSLPPNWIACNNY